MMSVLFAGMTAFALGCALLQGNLSALSDALLTGGSDAVSLMLRLVGGLCLWSGAMEVAVQSGLTRALSQALLPLPGGFSLTCPRTVLPWAPSP